jgi:7-cyano-7-deazaguanine synthase
MVQTCLGDLAMMRPASLPRKHNNQGPGTVEVAYLCFSDRQEIHAFIRQNGFVTIGSSQLRFAYGGGMGTSRVLILLSGGIDSAACLHYYCDQGYSVEGLFIDYGQPAASLELSAAERIAHHYSVALAQMELSGCSPKPSGFIQGRNAFLVLAALLDLPSPSTSIAMGIHSGTPYWDCTPDFVTSMQQLLDAYTEGRVRMRTPFLGWSKGQILRYCDDQDVPLSLTYSCERGENPPCGGCRSCRDREAASAT